MSYSGISIRPAPTIVCVCFALTASCASLPLTGERREAPVEPSAPAYLTQDILDATVSDIDALLGPPALTRREGEGEFRRYSLKQCELIVILYPDDNGAQRATHIDTAAQHSGSAKPALSECLAAG